MNIWPDLRIYSGLDFDRVHTLQRSEGGGNLKHPSIVIHDRAHRQETGDFDLVFSGASKLTGCVGFLIEQTKARVI